MSYEPGVEPREFMGVSRGDAVAKACAFFNADESGLTIAELGPEQVAGIGDRVLVVAQPEGAASRPRAREGRPRERESRGREREPRGREREPRGRERGGRGRERPRGSERESQPPEAEEPEGESIGTPGTELGPIGGFVKGLLERMDLGAFEISESRDGELTVVLLTGPAARRLRASDGRAAEGVQLLANQLAARSEEPGGRVVIDVEGDQAQRASVLERAAERAARRALESGRAVALEPMNGKDRRLIHVALRELEGIATMSIGEGRYRQVVVVPEGAPEYEEARRSERAAERE